MTITIPHTPPTTVSYALRPEADWTGVWGVNAVFAKTRSERSSGAAKARFPAYTHGDTHGNGRAELLPPTRIEP